MKRASCLIAVLVLVTVFVPGLYAQDGEVRYAVASNQTINARACPRLDCAVVTTFAPGDTLVVIDSVTGDTVFGSDQWHRVLHNGTDVYIHSALLEPVSTSDLPPVSAAPSVPGTWMVYEASGISIEAPPDWVDASDESDVLAQAGLDFLSRRSPDLSRRLDSIQSVTSTTGIVLADPRSGASVNVTSEYTGQELSLPLARLYVEDGLGSLGFEVVGSDIRDMPAGEALRVHVRFRLDPEHTTIFDQEGYFYLVSLNRTTYTLVFTTNEPTFEEFAPVFEAMADSFSIPSPDAARMEMAQRAGLAQLGDNPGVIPVTGFQLWEYAGEADEIVTITATATTLPPQGPDTRLIVRNPSGKVIAENDDSGLLGLNTNARVRRLKLSETGTYQIEVLAYAPFTDGTYTLSVEAGDGTPAPAQPQGQASRLSM